MASLDTIATTLAQLTALVAAQQQQLAALQTKTASAAPSAAGAGRAKRELSEDEKAKKREQPWILFTNRVRELLKSRASAKGGKETQQFAATLKDASPKTAEGKPDYSSWTDEDILARFASWTAPEVSKQKAAGKSWAKPKGSSVAGSEAASVVSGGGAAAAEKPKKERKNPWAGLSEEEKAERVAKMQAGRAAKKAAKDGALDDEPLGTSAEEATAAVAKTKAALSKAKAAKAASAAPKSPALGGSVGAGGGAPVAAALSAPSAPASDEFKPMLFKTVRYLYRKSDGHCYLREEDGTQGAWAGIFTVVNGKPTLDTSAPAPDAEDEEVFGDDE
jgi:hypothetical protein